MDDKPKCIWKKSLRGSRFFLIWLTLLVLIVLGFFIFGMTTNNYPPHQDFTDCWILFIFAGFGSLILLTFWAFIRWLCSWRNFKKFLFGGVCFVTLMALFYAEENWRGKHDWEKFKRAEEAKGEKFDWQSVIPPNVPDDQNFAFSPVWIANEKYTFQETPQKAEAWYGNKIYSDQVTKIFPLFPITTSAVVGTNNWESHDWTIPDKNGNWQTAQLTDLKPWQKFYRDLEKTNPTVEISITLQPQTPAQDVLLALSKFDPVIEQLRRDSARPCSRFPLNYDDKDPAEIWLPHLAALKSVSQVLQLRAIAELQNVQSEKALDDVNLALGLADSVRTEPFIITHLVRIAILDITLQPIYEGLAAHKWSDVQLAELDSELSKLDFLADYELSTRGERAAHIKIVDWLEHKRSRFWELFNMFDDDEKKIMNNFFLSAEIYLMPRGWYYQSEIALSQAQQEWVFPMVNDSQQIVSPQFARKSVDAVSSLRATAGNLFVRLLLPELGKYAQRSAYGQTSVNLARVAIALERYRLAQGNFPESLDALAPQFLEKIPHDIINGEPLHYRKTAAGNFVLYSVGWNERDDGGILILKKGSTPEVDRDQGDWVWKYPQN
jgi:hypothetical protein